MSEIRSLEEIIRYVIRAALLNSLLFQKMKILLFELQKKSQIPDLKPYKTTLNTGILSLSVKHVMMNYKNFFKDYQETVFSYH